MNTSIGIKANTIISASYKTDIPAFYGDWFMSRLEHGYCGMVNAYNRNQATFVSLRPCDVSGIVFWTKNIGPFMKHLDRVRELGFPFVVQHTINGYAQSRFEAVVSSDEAIENLGQIRNEYGPHVVVWRYDPIVITTNTPVEHHEANFAQLAEGLKGVTDEVVISFVQPYKKTQSNMREREAAYGFDWIDNHDFIITFEEHVSKKTGRVMRRRIWQETDESLERKRSLAQRLAVVAKAVDMQLTICSPPQVFFTGLLADPHSLSCPVMAAHCVETQRLNKIIASSEFAHFLPQDRPNLPVKIQGNRDTCECYPSTDIGEYDTCPYGCAYCYAVSHRETAKRFYTEQSSRLSEIPGGQYSSPFLDPRHMERFPEFRDDNNAWVQERFAQIDTKQTSMFQQSEDEDKHPL